MSQFISLPQAVDMTTLYRNMRETILAPEFRGQNILALSETFDRVTFDTLLAKSGCAGIRIYYGMDVSQKVHAIAVAVNDKNEDMLAVGAATNLTGGDDIVENGRRCPEDCPPESPLNGD
ncbi:MAG: hypothetical protein JNJ86_16940 [Chitinophagaceae bacterium]|nr:hypothetical protein [Chitinophagaceae bacterium]